jgi:hypothetical protein
MYTGVDRNYDETELKYTGTIILYLKFIKGGVGTNILCYGNHDHVNILIIGNEIR